MITTLMVLLVIYLVSAIGSYLAIRKTFLPGGDYHGVAPDTSDMVMVFIPFVNTFNAIMIGFGPILEVWISSCAARTRKMSRRFFAIKK